MFVNIIRLIGVFILFTCATIMMDVFNIPIIPTILLDIGIILGSTLVRVDMIDE